MPLELGVWKIAGTVQKVESASMDQEVRLENILAEDIGIASPNWLVIGRQVQTNFGKYVDLLAIDRSGNLVVIELKKNMTPREVVAQLLDYGSWVRTLTDTDIASIFQEYRKKYCPEKPATSINEAFNERFKTTEMPDELNESHELVVVASALDASTERIVTYLAEEYGVNINAVFFQVFRDGDTEYLTRVWFRDPTESDSISPKPPKSEEWNGEFYVSFGDAEDQRWEDAQKYGFIAAGGGNWYSKTLWLLEPGNRIWVNAPARGYVGVGIVDGSVVTADEFKVNQNGNLVLLSDLPLKATRMFENGNDPGKAEYLVPVKWVKTVPLDGAVKEKGFFGNQNSVCKPVTKAWGFTVERLKKRFEIE